MRYTNPLVAVHLGEQIVYGGA